jgi:Mor family transcriptional regulator
VPFYPSIDFVTKGKMIEEYKAGTSVSDLAQKYGKNETAVYKVIKAAGIVRPRPRFDGELADKLRKEYEAGANTVELAVKYSTSRVRVSQYIREAGGTIRPATVRTRNKHRQAHA